jgi:hypothetical protein
LCAISCSKRDLATIFNPNSHCRNRRAAPEPRVTSSRAAPGFFPVGLMIK